MTGVPARGRIDADIRGWMFRLAAPPRRRTLGCPRTYAVRRAVVVSSRPNWLILWKQTNFVDRSYLTAVSTEIGLD